MSRTWSSITAALILVMLLGAECSVIADSSPRADQRPGLFFGVALDGYPLTLDRLQRTHAELGLFPSMVVFFLQWPEDPDQKLRVGKDHFPRSTLQAIEDFGALPCLTWEPMSIDSGTENVILAERILNGQYDGYLRGFARAARDHGRPFLLRFAHEMNLARYNWGVTPENYGPEAPAVYRELFRYVVRLFREEEAHNVLFVFCPNAESIPHPIWSEDGAWNTATAYHPGHEYVDILGMDGYNWGTTQNRADHGWDSTFRSFAEIMEPMYRELLELHPKDNPDQDRKPFVVFETASAAQGGDKNAWIREAVLTMESWDLAGFVWFEANKEVDWRLSTGTDKNIIEFLQKRITANAADVLGL